jgi:hypothetical protein
VVGDGLGPERRQRDPALRGGEWGRVGLADPGGELELLLAQAPRAHAHQSVAALRVGEDRLDLLDVAAGPQRARLDPVGSERDRPQDVVAEPPDLAGVDAGRALDGPRQQRSGRAGVLEARVPGAARQAGRAEQVAVGLVQAGRQLGHRRGRMTIRR